MITFLWASDPSILNPLTQILLGIGCRVSVDCFEPSGLTMALAA